MNLTAEQRALGYDDYYADPDDGDILCFSGRRRREPNYSLILALLALAGVVGSCWYLGGCLLMATCILCVSATIITNLAICRKGETGACGPPGPMGERGLNAHELKLHDSNPAAI